MLDKIFIDNILVETIVGVYDFERIKKQQLVIDVVLYYDTKQAYLTDNLQHALDYHQICKDIYAFVENSSYELIETLAQELATFILLNKKIKKIKLKVSKPQALKDMAKNVGIKIKRKN